MKNDWYVSEETVGSNPDIYVESKSKGTICSITGGPLEERRSRARLVAQAPTLLDLPDLLQACGKAIEFYEWIIADWGATLDPDGDIPPDLESLRTAVDRVKASLAGDDDGGPNLFDEPEGDTP